MNPKYELAVNKLFIFNFSYAVRVGLIVYLVSAFGGSVLSALFNQNGVSVGASGALFGLLGVMLSELITNWTIYASKVSTRFHYLFLFTRIQQNVLLLVLTILILVEFYYFGI